MLPFSEMMKTTGGKGLRRETKNLDLDMASIPRGYVKQTVISMILVVRGEVRAGNNLEFRQTWKFRE